MSNTKGSSRLVYFGNEYPSDDLKELFRRLVQHTKDRRFKQLTAFVREATAVLKQEVAKLPAPTKALVPHFDTILTLAEHGDFRHGALGAAMESALLTVLELGLLIGHYEAEDRELDLLSDQTTLAGLSIGLLAGAAVALSRSIGDLVNNGAEGVRVSFRLGVYVDDISRKLEAPQPDGTLQSWAHVVTEMTEEAVKDEVTRFSAETGSPELTKVFISAADKTSVSVSGPPSRIRHAFQHSQLLRYSKSLPLPVYDGLCHAKHLYSQEDIDLVINSEESVIPVSRPVLLPLLSSQTGKPFAAETASELYSEIGAELLTGTIYLDKVTTGIVSAIGMNLDSEKCRIDSFRTSLVFKGIMKAVEQHFPASELSRHDMVDWVHKDFGDRRPQSCADSKLAIVGMACRMPGGANNEELFWDLLEQGRDAHTKVPADRFDLETHYDPTGQTENATQTPYGNFMDKPGLFDAGFFNMSPKEAEQTDPMARLALVTAYEAMEMAGVVPGRTASTRSSRIGTYYGQASDDWRELNASQNIGTYAVPGGERAFANGRINYFFKFSGPSFNVDTACSSGLAAVNAACSALWAGEADTVLAGGLNVITDPDNYAGLGNAHFLSKTGQCKVWDKDADGYCRADGVGSVVIKRLEDAEADNDNILAVVLSATTNHSAEAISITHPEVGAQKANYRQVLQRAGVNPLDVSYIELHGTGTQAGDAVESESIADTFAPVSPRRRADQRLHLGAAKANIGHGEAAAGIASLLKTLLVYQKCIIPRHIGIKTEINSTIPKDLERRNIGLAFVNTPWPRVKGKKRTAVVNSFGAHGGNTTVLLEDGPEKMKLRNGSHKSDNRSTHPIIITAKSKKSLQANMQNLLTYLEDKPETDVGDLSYTLCARRMQFNFRMATAVSSVPNLRKFLRSSLDNKAFADVRPTPSDTPSVVLAFTGQGAYYQGLGRDLMREFPYFRGQVQQLDRLVQRLGFPSVLPVMEESVEHDPVSPLLSQLSVVVLEIAVARFWSLLGVRFSAVIGHSLGEYAALAVAGVISTADALYLVGRRAQLIDEYCTPGTHAMLSVRASPAEIKRVLGSAAATSSLKYEVSCRNTEQDTVLGGPTNVIAVIRQTLEVSSYKCTVLDLPYAFHTAQMDPVLDILEKTAEHVPFKSPSLPVLSPLLGSAVFDGKTINANYLRRATREMVDFTAAIEAAQDIHLVDQKTLWIDVGPHPICANFLKTLIPAAAVISSCRRNEDNMATMSKSLVALQLAGLTPCWQEYFKPNEQAYQMLNLPRYSWNNTDYWIQYVGGWTLTKALHKYGSDNGPKANEGSLPHSTLRTSLIHQVTEEEITSTTATLRILSDLQHPDFLEAVHGHTMNNCGVATSSIWSDMALTIGEYLYRAIVPGSPDVHMNFGNFEVLHAQVAKKAKGSTQPLAVEAHLDLDSYSMSMEWFNIDAETGEQAPEGFASGTVSFENPDEWRSEWDRVSHLVLGRIEALELMAAEGKASRLSKSLAYTLFKNVVDYADRYRGMDSVVLHDHEAYADITLVPERHGTWHTPPHWIDSVSHLAGLIMNGSDASNTRDFFYVTPGCDSFRLLNPLQPGARYRSYVRMFPMVSEDNMHAGDVYIMQGETIVGMVGQIRFRRVPRVLMDRFFSPADGNKARAAPAHTASAKTIAKPVTAQTPGPTPARKPQGRLTAPKHTANVQVVLPTEIERLPPTPPSETVTPPNGKVADIRMEVQQPLSGTITPPESEQGSDNSPVGQCLQLIARETGLSVSDLTPDATFAQLGVDSLMSLVLSEKFRAELSIEIKSSLFLECPTIGDMKGWIEQYC